MPHSEREQQILSEIEKNLQAEDPRFARQVKQTSPSSREIRNVKLGIAIFVAGFALLIAFFWTQHIFIGVGAFGAMVGGIVMIAGSLRASIGAGRRGESDTHPKERFERFISDWEDKIRQRYKKP